MDAIAHAKEAGPSRLGRMLAYRNEDVLSRFTDHFRVGPSEAEGIFRETVKFLWLTQEGGVFIPDDLLILDEMWHNFILFTREYQAFCQEHFGAFNHHAPATRRQKEEEKAARAADPEGHRRRGLERLRTLMELTYDRLGEETAETWFRVYPERYSPERIRALRR